MLKPRSLKRNQLVFREGDPCNSVFIVLKGEFEVKKKIKAKVLDQKVTGADGFDYTEFLP
jgi:hypothetical protein